VTTTRRTRVEARLDIEAIKRWHRRRSAANGPLPSRRRLPQLSASTETNRTNAGRWRGRRGAMVTTSSIAAMGVLSTPTPSVERFAMRELLQASTVCDFTTCAMRSRRCRSPREPMHGSSRICSATPPSRSHFRRTCIPTRMPQRQRGIPPSACSVRLSQASRGLIRGLNICAGQRFDRFYPERSRRSRCMAERRGMAV
jgi:hypothetical protein